MGSIYANFTLRNMQHLKEELLCNGYVGIIAMYIAAWQSLINLQCKDSVPLHIILQAVHKSLKCPDPITEELNILDPITEELRN